MKEFVWIPLAAFVMSLLLAWGLHAGTGDYFFDAASAAKEDAAQSGPSPEQVALYTKSSGEAQVDDVQVQAIFLNPLEEMDSQYLVFQISLNTHGVDMTQYDITKNAVIEDSRGRKITTDLIWQGSGDHSSSHHIMGALIAANPKGEAALLDTGAKWIKLTLKGIPKEQVRELKWDIQ